MGSYTYVFTTKIGTVPRICVLYWARINPPIRRSGAGQVEPIG